MAKRTVIRGALIAAFAVGLFWTRASAAGPNTYPGGAVAPGSQSTVISAGTTLWYNFDYAGDRSKVEITLQNGFINNLAFNLYAPDQISPPNDFGDPIGKGTQQTINCDGGKCVSDNLLWAGDFFVGGTFYVQVMNPNSVDKPFTISVTGSGVTLHAPPAPVVSPYTYSPPTTSYYPAYSYSYPAQTTYPPNGYYPGSYPSYPSSAAGYSVGPLPPPVPVPYVYSPSWTPAYPSAPSAGFYSSGGCYHAVVSGDTLSSIAARYRTDLWQLARANGLSNPNLIFVGQRLNVPNCQ